MIKKITTATRRIMMSAANIARAPPLVSAGIAVAAALSALVTVPVLDVAILS